MARDHRRLRAFHRAHRLTLAIYEQTKNFPKDEWFGLRAQMRRAATSISSNIVEGSARRSAREYLNFINIARASAGELLYLIGLAMDLQFLSRDAHAHLATDAACLVAELESLVQQLELLCGSVRPKAESQKPKA
jgi:four helix bundle protein